AAVRSDEIQGRLVSIDREQARLARARATIEREIGTLEQRRTGAALDLADAEAQYAALDLVRIGREAHAAFVAAAHALDRFIAADHVATQNMQAWKALGGGTADRPPAEGRTLAARLADVLSGY